ncbi:nucleotide exchange factor GrpE [bacterium]|nr:nucleotide exchange factor GrpE [bacterium]
MSNKNKDKENSSNPFAQKENVEENIKDEQTENKVEESNVENQSSSNEEVEKLKNDLEILNNQYVRLAADFENFRKRQAQEKENFLKYGCEKLLKNILPVLDTIDRAQKTIDETEDANILKESYNVVIKQLIDVLHKEGLEVIEAQGKEFDPNWHEAIMRSPLTEGVEPNTIVAELQKGYKLGDKVLRATLVNVASAE